MPRIRITPLLVRADEIESTWKNEPTPLHAQPEHNNYPDHSLLSPSTNIQNNHHAR
jgi:hypothetical protein